MTKIEDIKELINYIVQSPIRKFCIEYDSMKLSLEKEATNFAAATMADGEIKKIQEQPVFCKEQVNTASELHEVISPILGIFYRSPDPESAPFAQIGDKVTADSVVCVVEAMKMFNEIQAEISGEIVKVLVENGQLVEYGQPLFLIRQN